MQDEPTLCMVCGEREAMDRLDVCSCCGKDAADLGVEADLISRDPRPELSEERIYDSR